VLTHADDYPVHQTPEPVALCQSDRNFYDRYFFNGYAPDGSVFFAVAFGMYPNINIADAHFSVVRDGVQDCLHASRFLNHERMNLAVGPIRIEVIEPLQKLRVSVALSDGIAAELVFDGRAFPIQEPRFTHRFGTRVFMDMTRLTQNARVSGWIEVDGVRTELPDGSLGTRDRSWGVRPLGAPDAQPYAPPFKPSVFWLWTPLHFATRSVFFHVMAEASGKAWNTRAVVCDDAAGAEAMRHSDDAHADVELVPGQRHAASAVVHIPLPGRQIELLIEPLGRFQMKGIGYRHPNWTHGMFKGELVVERESFAIASLDPAALEHLHVQAFSRVTWHEAGRPDEFGIGTFEYSMVGAYAPLDLV
jgi:hypothetical protein